MQHAPLVIDIAGLALTDDDRRRISHPLVGGLILFGRNWRDRAQLTALCAEAKALRPDLLVCVDHEGGRVQRFRSDGFTHLPPMRALGAMWTDAAHEKVPGEAAMEAMSVATACGYVLAAELRACGVDFSFTPVLDLDHGGSGVIGDRAFARDPRVVAMLARCLVQGLQQAGMAHCGKHFPGHGFVRADSHTAVPVDRRSLRAILADDAQPYRWLDTVLTAVMPAHVVYPKVDDRPAGFSRRWLQEILRGDLGFGGAIFSDDLSMAAARMLGGRPLDFTGAALAALAAGCDMAVLCNQSLPQSPGGGTAIDDLIEGVARAQIEGVWQPSEASEARRQALLPTTAAADWDTLMTQPAYMQALWKLP